MIMALIYYFRIRQLWIANKERRNESQSQKSGVGQQS